MKINFTDLNIPFPLFEAPIDEAGEYIGRATCSLCNETERYCFKLGIGTDLIVSCSQCTTQNGLDADDQKNISCRMCGNIIQFPKFSKGQLLVCYKCLRNGKAALTKDTELGMVSLEQAFEGVTHGLPYVEKSDFELVPKSDGWVGARVPQEYLFELLRTPSYLTWQGEKWLFCCQKPMIYLGNWGQNELQR